MRNAFCVIWLLLFIPATIEAQNDPDLVFYRNEGINIEFRILLEDQEKIPWIILQDREGTPQRVSKEIVISSNDIAGFTIDDVKPNFDDVNGFTIHFEPDSWGKIREVTGRLKGKRIAFLRDGQIFWSPTIHETLTRSASVSWWDKEKFVEEFFKDFPTENIPEQLYSDTLYERFLLDWMNSHPDDLEIRNSFASLSSPKIYEKFLVNWVDLHPQDLRTMRELINFYFEDKTSPEFDKALPLVQRFVKARPEDSEIQIRFIQCYLLMGKNEKALATGIQALSHAPIIEKTILLRMVGELQYEMGHKKDALESLEASLENIRKADFPNLDRILLSEKSTEKTSGGGVSKKEEMIQQTTDRINYILAH